MPAAVKTGFDKALLAVLDANITTFIAGIVLYTRKYTHQGICGNVDDRIISTLFTGCLCLEHQWILLRSQCHPQPVMMAL